MILLVPCFKQVQSLVTNHEDVFQIILHDSSNVHTLNSLKQLSLTIAIISLLPITDKRDDAWEILTDDQRHWRTFMNRIHRLMLTLLNKYSTTSSKKVTNELFSLISLEFKTIFRQLFRSEENIYLRFFCFFTYPLS